MVRKLLSVSDEIAERMSSEPNQSALVDALLHLHYKMPVSQDGWHNQKRAEMAQTLGETEVAFEDVSVDDVPTEEPLISAAELPVSEPEETVDDETVDLPDYDPSSYPADTTPLEEEDVAPLSVDPDPVPTEVTPMSVPTPEGPVEVPQVLAEVTAPVEDVAPLEELTAPEVTPEPEPTGQVTTELKINYLGQSGGVCDIHGPHAGSYCLDCL